MKRILLVYALLAITLWAGAQVIPLDRRVNWSTAGFTGSFPDPALVVNVMDFGATGNGVTNDYPAVAAAIAALGGNQGVVFFPAGNYLLNTGLVLPDSVILRGVAGLQSRLRFNLGGLNMACVNVSGTGPSSYTPLITGYVKDSGWIRVTDPGLFSAGDYIQIREDNGSWDTNPATWAEYAVGQIVGVVSISGDTLFLEDPLRITFEASLNPTAGPFTPKTHAGIESLYIERIDDVPTSGPNNVLISFAKDCWIRGVESNKSVGSHIVVRWSTHIEISGCYFHDAFAYDGSSNHGYGVTLNNHCGLCLVENNIFKHLRHAMMTKVGANGNVFGYNYSLDVYRTEYPNNYSGDISLHGHFSFCNLFEGNIVQNIITDHAWGPSGPYNSFFRNRAELYGIIITSGTLTTSYQNYVGNEITNTGFLMGQYSLSGSNHFEYGNNLKGNIIPSGTNNLPDESYYCSQKPEFWDINMNWPSIGIPNTISSGTIQAKLRYQNSDFTYMMPVPDAGPDVVLVFGTNTILNGSVEWGISPYSYTWSPATGLSNPNIPNPVCGPMQTTVYTLTVRDSYGVSVTDETTVTVIPASNDITLNLKAYLEGPYIGPYMRTNLNMQGMLPLSQPYNNSPWLYNGTEAVASIPDPDIVDWILVELRDAPSASLATPASIIARTAAFLHKDGTITGTDGTSHPVVNAGINHSLFAVLWHRNHLGIMSANALTSAGGIYSYDFSTGPGQVYGGTLGYSYLDSGVWGLVGGDGDASGEINNGDKNDVWVVQSGLSGYYPGDFTMDGEVNNGDKIEVWRPNGGLGSQVPD
ncbi:MAG: hypothetical protein JW861_04470 [Bacteroidales bacterium]|nr:hypothetical protein [Bacteroidales bacterium]